MHTVCRYTVCVCVCTISFVLYFSFLIDLFVIGSFIIHSWVYHVYRNPHMNQQSIGGFKM